MTGPAHPAGLVVISVDDLRELIRSELAPIADRAPPSDEPMLLTCAALCRRLGVSRATIFRLRKEGLPALKCGDEFRYEIDAVLTWIRGRK